MPSSSSSGRSARRARRRRPRPGRRRGPGPRARARGSRSSGDVVRQQLGEDAALADPPRDQLRVLAAEVEDQDLLAVGPGGVAALDARRVRLERRRASARRRGPASARPAALAASVIARRRPPLATAARPFEPMPTACSRWSCLPSVWSAGATITSARWNVADVLVAAGRHRGAQRAHQVEGAVVLAAPGRAGSPRACRPASVATRAPRGSDGMEGRHAPVVAAAGRLLGARERRADHHRVGAAGDRLGDVAAGAHAAVGDHVARTRRSRACAGSGRPATSAIAVACGTPMPSTPRVVQAAPGPTPTSTPTAPVRIRCRPVE